MTVVETIALGKSAHGSASVSGHLIVTQSLSYLVEKDGDAVGILVTEPTLLPRLLEVAPPLGGSIVLYFGPAAISGELLPTVLPMFPVQIHSLTIVEYRHEGLEPYKLKFV